MGTSFLKAFREKCGGRILRKQEVMHASWIMGKASLSFLN